MRGWGGIKYFFLLFIINYKRSFDVYVKKLHSGLDGAKAVESEQLLLSAVWHNIKVFSLYLTYGNPPPPNFEFNGYKFQNPYQGSGLKT